MQTDSKADCPQPDDRPAVCDVRLATRISQPVDHRLRMLALAQRRPLSHVLTQLLDQVLPPADALLEQLRDGAPAGAAA